MASIHLENRTHGEGRRAQLETVLQAAERLLPGIPVVLGGDLNTNTFDGRDKDAIQEIAGSAALQRRCLTPTASRTISTRTADCTFARPGSALARFAGEELSDHNAVWASCRMD